MSDIDWQAAVHDMLGDGYGCEDIAIRMTKLGSPTTPDMVRSHVGELREAGLLSLILKKQKKEPQDGIRKDERG